MKTTLSILVYLITFFALYFGLSLFGCIFFIDNAHPDFDQVAGDKHWFFLYTIFIGLWISLIPARDIYEQLEKKGL